MPEKPQYQIRVFAEKDRVDLMKLLSDTFKMSSDFLVWKYDLNPDFDESLIIIAVNQGQVVGCMNWLPRSLKISKSSTVRAALGADLAVHRNHRGRGLAKPLIASENTILKGKNIIMSYGYIDPQLVKRVHGPLLGLVEVPTSTIVYKKYLTLANIRRKILEMNEAAKSGEETERKLARVRMSVLFRLRGFPQFKIRISPDATQLEENDLTDADLRVECDLTLLELFKSKRKTLTVIKALLTRRVRIKGSLRKTLKLYRIFNLVRVLFE